LVRERDDFRTEKVGLLRERDELTKGKEDFIRANEAFVGKKLNMKGYCRNWRGS
jgi:hypothetical protein